MVVAVNTFFEERLEGLFGLAALLESLFLAAGVDYVVVGGLAVYLYVEQAQPDAGRLTRDIDIVARRQDLQIIAQAAKEFGLEYRHSDGVDMLVQTAEPTARRAVHIIFSGEKVRPEYPEPTLEIGKGRLLNGIRVAPLADLVRMKLSSFRLKDQMHLIDLDEAGLITSTIETQLGAVHLERLTKMRPAP